jgi:hypothetical protein
MERAAPKNLKLPNTFSPDYKTKSCTFNHIKTPGSTVKGGKKWPILILKRVN